MKTKIYILLFAAFSLSACEKLIEVDPPTGQLSAKAVFENETTTRAVLSNLYGASHNFLAGAAGSPTIQAALAADETNCFSTNPELQQVANGQLLATSTYTGGIYTAGYQMIYNSNTLIEGVNDNPKLSKSLCDQITGEALFFRAYGHLTLRNFYGSIPLALTTDYRINAKLSRTPETQVLQQVINDLQAAIPLLPKDYATTPGERIRVNAYAAMALLARAQLYAGRFVDAETTATEIIASPLFALLPLNELFLKGSREAIFQIRTNSTTFSSADGNQFVLTGRPSSMALRQSFVDSFELGDLRKSSWIGKFTLGAESWNYPFKYKTKTSTTLVEHSTVLRLAEIYLIRAEARARLDKTDLGKADLNSLRVRAGLPTLATGLTQTELLEKVLAERRSELFTEGTHRWVDLKRFGKAQELLSAAKPGWSTRALLYPIPVAELGVNPNLSQNAGY